MYTKFHHDGEKMLLNMPSYLRRHDIVYRRPTYKPYEGFPVGNGTMGGLVSLTPESLEINLNHTDAVDYREDGDFSAWAWEEEEKQTNPVSGARIRLGFSAPVFDWTYLSRFEGRLNLADGTASYEGETPFSKVRTRTWCSADPSVMVIEVKADFDQPMALTARMENWGSPAFFHHYEQVVRTHSRNMDNMSTGKTTGGVLLLSRSLRRCDVVTGMTLCGPGGEDIPHSLQTQGTHVCSISLPASEHHRFCLLLSCGTTPPPLFGEGGTPSPAEQVCDNLAAARTLLGKEGNALKSAHEKAWEEFWNRSFVHLGDEDYLENLYYFHLYQLGCCSRGNLPVTFAGLWGWFKDSRNWGHFYHWNHQQTYWGLDASGYGDLGDNYYRYRTAMLPMAQKTAKTLGGGEGASFFSDISNFNGYNSLEPDTVRNFTVGPQIALDFYRHWQYTGDVDFLKGNALPLMVSSARFYLSHLALEDDGKMRIPGGTTDYESYWNLRETLTDRVYIPLLFEALLSFEERGDVPRKMCEEMRGVLEKLPPYPTIGSGEETLFSAGIKRDGTPVKYGEGTYPLSPFPATLTAPFYPHMIGEIAHADSPLRSMGERTLKRLIEKDVFQPGTLDCSGHTPAPQSAARMGLGKESVELLRHFARTYQMFPNGFMHFADLTRNQQWSPVDFPRVLEGNEKTTEWQELHDKARGNRTSIDSESFLHCYFEAESNIFAGIQENLLQERDGVLTLFPGKGGFSDACFTLMAPGGFRVSGEKSKGEVLYAVIESLAKKKDEKPGTTDWGRHCYLTSPWAKEKTVCAVRSSENPDFTALSDGKGCLKLELEPGERIILCPDGISWDNVYKGSFEEKINKDVKYLDKLPHTPEFRGGGLVSGTVQLGLPSLY